MIKKIALFCEVPSNIVRAVQIKRVLYPKDKVTLYILKHKKVIWKKEIIETLLEEGLFETINFIEESEIMPKNKASLVWIFINPWKKIKKYMQLNKYDEIYVFHMSQIIIPIIYTEANRANPQFLFNIWEEGAGATLMYGEQKKWRKRIFKIGKIIDPINEKKHYRYWTSSLEEGELEKRDNVLCFGTPRIRNEDKDFVCIINKVFGYKIDEKINSYKILILEQECLEGREFIPQNADIELFNKALNYFEQNDILVKIHPRSNPKRFSNKYNVFIDRSIPFEVFLLNYDMNDKVLITISSSSVLAPKFLMDNEPFIVVLYELVEFSDFIKDYLNYSMPFYKKSIETIKKMYSDSGKICTPKSEEEYCDLLSSLAANI